LGHGLAQKLVYPLGQKLERVGSKIGSRVGSRVVLSVCSKVVSWINSVVESDVGMTVNAGSVVQRIAGSFVSL
jgi:hypothetical protein